MLESFFKFLIHLSQSFFSFLKILVRSKLFLARHKAEAVECIVLGNGPSLKKVLADHTEALKSQTLLCVNKFPDTEMFELLKPRYFIFNSTGYWKPEPIVSEQTDRDNIMKALIRKTTWPLTLFCPHQASSNPGFIQHIKTNPNIEICYFNNTPVEGLSALNLFFMRKGWGMPRPHNVLIPSILNLINAGFRKIYLVGADHSWLPLISVNEKNDALINQKHFYDADVRTSGYMYRNSKPRRLHEILEKLMLSFRSYFDIKAYAQTRGVEVFNCTQGSFIDAFERKNIAEVFEKKATEEVVKNSKSKA